VKKRKTVIVIDAVRNLFIFSLSQQIAKMLFIMKKKSDFKLSFLSLPMRETKFSFHTSQMFSIE
jgi:hypothetical protein